MERAPILMIIAFPRLPLGKWEKVPKGDEGSLPRVRNLIIFTHGLSN